MSQPLSRPHRPSWLLPALLFAASLAGAAAAAEPAFPGAQGWAASTPGGRDGPILRVTTLAADGPGSFAEAVAAQGPRTVVFEVGGVIDLGLKALRIREPFLTIAGQTAPAPGITFIRGGIDIATHDVVVRHIRVRPGDAGLPKRAGVDFDAISTIGARDVIVDHCSLTWATDEGLSASGPRFGRDGAGGVAAYRAATSQRITFSNNLVAEGLSHATHAKGEHSKGSLIHDNVGEVLIVGNLYAHNRDRNPLFKGGASGQVVNNLIYNPGQRGVHYNLIGTEWKDHPHAAGSLRVQGNVLRAGPSTGPLAFFMLGGDGDVDLQLLDNLAFDPAGGELPMQGRYHDTHAQMRDARIALAPALAPTAAADVPQAVLARAGATPWRRDPIDQRILADVVEGRGRIIDSQDEVGGYPEYAPTRRAFVEADWDLRTMEPRHGYAALDEDDAR